MPWRLERSTGSSAHPGHGDAHTRKVPSRTNTLLVGEHEDSAGNARSHWVRLWGSNARVGHLKWVHFFVGKLFFINLIFHYVIHIFYCS